MKRKAMAALMAGAIALTSTACASTKPAAETNANHNSGVNAAHAATYETTVAGGDYYEYEAECGENYFYEDFNTEEYNTF